MQKIFSVLLFFCLFTPTLLFAVDPPALVPMTGQTTGYAAPLDTTPPTITAFGLPATSSSLTVNITSLSTTDDVGVTAYCLREADSSAGCAWSVTVPTGYLFTAGGYRILYAFVRDAAGNVSNGASASTTVTLTSATPASITVPTTNDSGSYTVSWSASTTAGATYVLQEATNSTFTTGSRNLYIDGATSAAITGRSTGTTYYYRVKARKTGNFDSSYRTATNGCVVTLRSATPVSITVPAANDSGSYTVSWSASTTAGATYVLQEATNATFTAGTRNLYIDGATSAAITGRSTGVTYYYRVKARKTGNFDSSYRTATNGCVVTLRSATPATITVPGTNDSGSYTVSWSDSTTAGATYVLQEATNSTFTTGSRNLYIATTSAAITGRSTATTYYYRVKARKTGNFDSSYKTATNGCIVTLRSATPATITVPTVSASGSYTVSWSASATAGATYVLQEATNSTFTTGSRNLYIDGATSAAITGRSIGATYYYRVKARKTGYFDSYYQTAGNGCEVVVSDSHYDDPATATAIEGVIVKTADIEGCQACHYADHNPLLTINDEWAKSAHGGHLATGPVTSATADAWVHYNWDDTATRGACQRCHTATGISNFLNNPTGYVANGSGNDFSHLSNWSATGGSGQQEVLYCWGCHSDVSEASLTDPKLRNPGAITENYTAVNNAGTGTTGTVAVVTYPDVGPSNVCIGCHIGREIGQNIKNITDADGRLGFVNSHYLTAGGTVFNTSGYEYAGQTYANFGFHKNIGVGDPASNINTGSSGPCVTCHMSVTSGHTFSFVTKGADGTIEANNSPICTNCHAAMDAGTLQASKERFETALEELKLALDARGIFFFNAHPYFYKGAGGTGGAYTDWESVATTLGVGLTFDQTGTGWKNVMGAAFNYNTFEHDPGAYAHNSDYALKLIADSIDYLDNGLVDGSIISFASTQIGVAGGAGFSPIHGEPAVAFVGSPVATAVANPTGSQATCSACHPAAPHYGGYPTGEVNANGVLVHFPQWVNNQVESCAECHANNDPSLNQPILSQYADSGHGDVNGVWTREEDGSCSRCHTTTGYIGNMATPATMFSYVPADPLQTLNCNACHTSLVPGLLNATRRPAEAFIATWTTNSVTASVVYPNAGDSNLCIRCHSARRAGPNITNLATTTAHYIPAAAVLFGGTTTPAPLVTITANTLAVPTNGPAVGTTFTGGGYEFAGQVYANAAAHKTAGIDPLSPATSPGPCVTCHMSGTAGHTWNAVTHNEVTGEISAINSSACNTALCHNGALTPASLNALEATFATARAALDTQLNVRSIFFNPANGIFYRDAAFTTTVNNAYYATQAAVAPVVSTRDLQGATFNFWLFTYHGADPAGYVHNTFYALKLINDSADLLNDGLINSL